MPNMKVIIFLGMFLVIISCAQAISKQDFFEAFTLEERSLIQSNEQAHDEVNVTTRYAIGGGRRLAGFGGGRGGGMGGGRGGGMGGGRMGGGMGGGRGGGMGGGIGKGGMRGGGGRSGGGKGGRGGRAGAAAGGAAAGIIGGGILGGVIGNHYNNGGNNIGPSSSAATLSAGSHYFVPILILCVTFRISSHLY